MHHDLFQVFGLDVLLTDRLLGLSKFPVYFIKRAQDSPNDADYPKDKKKASLFPLRASLAFCSSSCSFFIPDFNWS